MKSRLAFTALLFASAALFSAGCVTSVWVPLGPPDALVEVHGGIPGAGFVWLEGYWEWHNRWAWQPGHWARPPHANARWEAPRWERGSRGWRFHRGRWQ